MRHPAFCLCLCVGTLLSVNAQMLDSAIVTGHYTQEGMTLERRDMEKVLLKTPVAGIDVDNAKGLRISGGVLSLTTWLTSTGVTAYQIFGLVDAMENDRPYSQQIDDLVLPLTIGGQIATFIQARLRNKSNYLFHRGVLEYNRQLCRKQELDLVFDHRIKNMGGGWYEHDGLLLPSGALSYVLAKQPESRGHIARSVLYREVGSRTVSLGSSFLGIGIIRVIDDQPRSDYQGYIVAGSILAGFGIINTIATTVARKNAIRAYNKAVPSRIPCNPDIILPVERDSTEGAPADSTP